MATEQIRTKAKSKTIEIFSFQIEISGCVQGVGFRPFVYGLATEYGLCGEIKNTEKGVQIVFNATTKQASIFCENISFKKPQVAEIQSLEMQQIPTQTFEGFKIITSTKQAKISTPLTPDFALCSDCKTEINDPNNRRFQYPFTTCVSCGPRYSITTHFPFEREHTTMDSFHMCDECHKEYADPNNRRFHSQTNSCSSCGVQLQLTDKAGEIITENNALALKQSARAIVEGKIVVIKNTSGYLICCDANNKRAIENLRHRKKRPRKPFAVLYPSITAIENEFELSKVERETLLSYQAPIVLLNNKASTIIANEQIAPGLTQIGVMLPNSGLLQLLSEKVNKPMVVTSGNIHNSTIVASSHDAKEKLHEVADFFVHHNLGIQFPQDDSVIVVAGNQPVLLRRSRGFAPNISPLLPQTKQPLLAVGAHLKSSFAYQPDKSMYLSPYFGSLEHISVLQRFEITLNQYIDFFDNTPKIVLIDKHPNYQSRLFGEEWAKKWGARCIEVQHHHAHFFSVIGEHQLQNSEERILGVIWDGNGWGEDGHIWGGEFFVYHEKNLERNSHFSYFPWLANDKMAREPRLSLLSLSEDEAASSDHFDSTTFRFYLQLKTKADQMTSSVGRLLDAVAAALELITISTYEAEAALLLTQCAQKYTGNAPIDIMQNQTDRLDTRAYVTQIQQLHKKGIAKEKIAYSFFYTLCETIVVKAQALSCPIIVCSGGVFQNQLLIDLLKNRCNQMGLHLKLNCNLSPNDENIAFGQATYYHLKKEKSCV